MNSFVDITAKFSDKFTSVPFTSFEVINDNVRKSGEKNLQIQNKYYLTSNTGGTARRKIMNELSKKIHEKNETFKKPKTVTTVNVEKETFPAQLCSEFTPTEMCIEEFFVRGTEPTDVSKRYSKLDNPTNGAASFDGSNITLTWDAISTPDTINTSSLVDHFNKYYGNYSTK